MITYGRLPPGPCKLVDDHTVRKTFHTSHRETLDFMEALCTHLIKRPDPLIVPVYQFRSLGLHKGYYDYCYDMMRCGNLSQQEKDIVNAVGDAYSRDYTNPTRNFLESADVDPYESRENFPALMEFLDLVIEQRRYHDLHSGNVMINHDNDYCIIDLEGFTNAPLNLPENNWIIRES